jgi:hypothetical protein
VWQNTGVVFGTQHHFAWVLQLQLLREYRGDARLAELPLALAHAGTSALLDLRDGDYRQHAVRRPGIQYLRFRHALTPTYNVEMRLMKAIGVVYHCASRCDLARGLIDL